MTTYYRTVYQVEVLSIGPFDGGESLVNMSDLAAIAYEIDEGDCSGAVTEISSEEVTRERMAELLEAQGSEPEFLLGTEESE